jgi:tellurite resistance protein
MSDPAHVRIVPASLFSIVLGLSGLANAWRAAHRVWQLPSIVGEALHLVAGLVWLALVASYVAKWVRTPAAARTELDDPVQACFVGLVGVATMLVAGGVLPYARGLGVVLFAAGAAYTIAFAVWRTGGLWEGGRDPAMATPVLYLPAGAGSFVAASTAALLGATDWARLLFGAGLFSWLAIESVVLQRLLTSAPLAEPLRPTLGIQLAPPTVGGLAYLAGTDGPPDVWASVFLGYGILQALVLLRLLPFIRRQPFNAGYWSFTFGASALATLPVRMVERGSSGAVAVLAPALFALANVAIAVIAARTLALVTRGRLLPLVARPA